MQNNAKTWKEGDPERRSNLLTQSDIELIVRLAKGGDKPRIFGISIELWAQFGMALFFLTGFYIRTDDAMKRLITTSDYLVKFTENSDRYHSAKTGVQFQHGAPLYFQQQKTTTVTSNNPSSGGI